MLNIKLIKDCLDNPIWSNNSFCKCKKKIIRKPIDTDNRVIYCELCDCPILVEDMDKIVDDWRRLETHATFRRRFSGSQ